MTPQSSLAGHSAIAGSGYQYAQANPNAKKYKASEAVQSVTLPPKVDLRPYLTPVEDQGNTNSCTANAIAGAYEYLLKKHLNKPLDVSRLFIYYNARWRAGDQNEDSGSVIQYGMEGVQSFGSCTEPTWPFQVKRVTQKPSAPSYTEAARFRGLIIQKLPVDLKAWKRCLAEGYPIVFGCALFESFDNCSQNGGVVPMPNPKDVARGSHGAHAMLCVGYSEVEKVFIVRNSWGAAWGDRGYCYMPYNYLMSKKFNLGDCWMMRSEDDLPDPQDTWIENRKPVIKNKPDFEINAYPVTAYDSIPVQLISKDEVVEYQEEAPEDFVEYVEAVEPEAYVEDDEDYLFYDDEEYDEDEEEEDEEYEEEEEEYEEEDEDEEGEEYEEDEEDEEEEEYEEEEDEEEEDEEEEDEEEYEEGEEEYEEEGEEYEDDGEAEESYEEDDGSEAEDDGGDEGGGDEEE